MLIVCLMQTNHVLSKAQASRAPATRATSKAPSLLTESSDDFVAAFEFNDLITTDSDALITSVLPPAYNDSPPRGLLMSIEDQGNSFFFHHFVSESSPSPSSYSNFLPLMYNPKSDLGSARIPLPSVITAIGMAGISNMHNSPAFTVMVAARQKYTSVLRALNIALQDPKTASSDPTLMAIMLLGLFEVRVLSRHAPRTIQCYPESQIS